MPTIKLRLAHAARDPDFPADDDALGASLWRMLVSKLPRGVPRPALFTLFPEAAQIVDMPPILAAGVDVHQATASFASQPGVEALATVGVMTRRRGAQVLGRFAIAFVEWPDGRWWCSAHPLDSAGQLMEGVETDLTRAVDGAPKPAGLGAWFRRARFEGLTLKLDGGEVN